MGPKPPVIAVDPRHVDATDRGLSRLPIAMAHPSDSRGTSRAEDRIAEAIASKVIEIVSRELGVSAPAPVELIDAREVARRSGFSRAWVYENAGRLGAVRVGDGRRPRLRFDAGVVARVLDARATPRRAVPDEPEPPLDLAIHVPRIRSKGA